MAILRILAWCGCLCWACLIVSLYMNGMRRAESAIQEAAGSADACFWIIFGYVLARAMDAITKSVESTSDGGKRP